MTERQPRAPHYQRVLPFRLGVRGRDEVQSSAEAASRLVETGRRSLAGGDERAARAAFLEGARLGNVDGALAVALMLLRGAGGDADPEHGLEWLQFAAERSAPGAALLLGRIRWATVGAEADGVRWLRVAADTGEAEALHLLGLARFHGRGVAKDLVEARRLQMEAAKRGVSDAQFELSLLLAQGSGGKVDARGARRWEDKAAEAGHPRACLNRAARLASGGRPDFAVAARWYERAAEAGNAAAAARLCRMHVAGQGVARNEAAARRWYERAAELGYRWGAED